MKTNLAGVAIAAMLAGASFGASTNAHAALYNLSTSIVYPLGESYFRFKGTFDSDVVYSGAGTLSYEPIEAGDQPYQEQLSGLNFVLTYVIADSRPGAKVSIDYFPTYAPLFPLYFFIEGKNFIFDTVDNNGYSDGSLALSSVPLPASAPMFGAALLALGAIGYGVKRKKTATAV